MDARLAALRAENEQLKTDNREAIDRITAQIAEWRTSVSRGQQQAEVFRKQYQDGFKECDQLQESIKHKRLELPSLRIERDQYEAGSSGVLVSGVADVVLESTKVMGLSSSFSQPFSMFAVDGHRSDGVIG